MSFNLLAQKKELFPKFNVIKIGTYGGIQRGQYTLLEIGGEIQWKKLRLKKAKSNALNLGFNYNLIENVLGYDLGYWHRGSLIGLTYGANACLRTDFNEIRYGISPVIGYKFWLLHLQTGYYFLTPTANFENTNSFFVSLRLVIMSKKKMRRKKRKN